MQRAIVFAAALGIASTAIAADLQPGKYRTLSKTEGEKEPAQQSDECITQKDIDSGLTELGAQGQDKSCKVSDFKRGSGSVSYRSTCQQGGMTLVTDVNAKFSGDSFDMRLAFQVGKETTRMVISGKRIGACSKQKE